MLQSQTIKIIPILVFFCLFNVFFYTSKNESISSLHEKYSTLATYTQILEKNNNQTMLKILELESNNQQMKTQHKTKVENLTNKIELLEAEINFIQTQLQTNNNQTLEQQKICLEIQKNWESKMSGEGLDSETLKKFQPFWADHPQNYQSMKKLLQFFQSFITKHNIIGFISSGTLLGAVRHGGFIPWDDDVDVLVATEHLSKFTQFKQEISEAGLELAPFHSGLKLFSKDSPKFEKYNWSYPYLDIFEGFNLGLSTFRFHETSKICKKKVNLPVKPICIDGLVMNGPYDPEEWVKCVYTADVFSNCKTGWWNHLLEVDQKTYQMKCSELQKVGGGYPFT